MTKWYGEENLDPKDVYKRHAYSGNSILVGRLDERNHIVFNQPVKCIDQVNYESPDVYSNDFETYTVDKDRNFIITRMFDDRDLLIVNKDEYCQESIGYYDKGKIVFWEQYCKGI